MLSTDDIKRGKFVFIYTATTITSASSCARVDHTIVPLAVSAGSGGEGVRWKLEMSYSY